MISPVEKWVAERTGLLGNLNTESLLQWQSDKLKTQIEHARQNSRFYKDRLSTANHFADLPFTIPADIANDPMAFLAIPQASVARITTLTTSGTTGFKKRIFFSESDLERTIDFFATGMSTMVSNGQQALILISDDRENSMGSLLRTGLTRIGVSSRIMGDIQNAEDAINAASGIDCLIGMPAEILYMSRTEPDLRPRSILLTADFAPQCVIDSIRENWKCNVFTHYGLTEVGFGCAVDCEQHAGHHLRAADLIIEIIDPISGKVVVPGESGEIVITTLNNEAMPLIRYRTGDISRFIHEPCGCGGVLPRLARVEGRMENNLTVKESGTLSIHQLDNLIFADPLVLGFEAFLEYQGETAILTLSVDSKGSLNSDFLASQLPTGLNIRIKYAKTDPFTRRGKRIIRIA